jgi:hypothetical protein
MVQRISLVVLVEAVEVVPDQREMRQQQSVPLTQVAVVVAVD